SATKRGKRVPSDEAALHPALERWIAARGWTAFDFQRKTWRAIADGQSGLLHATTGSGKTYAVWLGLLSVALRETPSTVAVAPALAEAMRSAPARRQKRAAHPPLRVLWITPMRALAADTQRALEA